MTKELVYTPEPAIWHPVALLRRMAAEAWRFRELVRRLVVRDLRAQYRQSYLGYFWAFIPSLATAAGFTMAKNAQVLHIGDTVIPYPAFVMVGTVLWETFIAALNGPMESLESFKGVLSRIYVPPEINVFAKLGEVVVNLSIKLFLLAVIFVAFRIPISPGILLAPILLCLLILEGMAIGLILGPIAALYHDISKGLPVAVGFWFLLTPVVYPVPTQGIFSLIVKFNPATPLLVAIRDLATGVPINHPWAVAAVGVGAILFFLASLIAFRISIPFVIERSNT